LANDQHDHVTLRATSFGVNTIFAKTLTLTIRGGCGDTPWGRDRPHRRRPTPRNRVPAGEARNG
jgi:hypothetical protein